MKKHLILALMAAFATFSFCSCGDDEPEPNKNPTTENNGSNNGNKDDKDRAEQAFNALTYNQININGKVIDLADRFYYYEVKDYLSGKVQGIHIQSEGSQVVEEEILDMARVNLELGINWFGKNENLLSPTIDPNSDENKILIQVVKMFQMAEWPMHGEWFVISANYSQEGTLMPGLNGHYSYVNDDKTNLEPVEGFPLKQGNLNCWKEGTIYYVHFWGELKNGEACAFKLKMDASISPIWND